MKTPIVTISVGVEGFFYPCRLLCIAMTLKLPATSIPGDYRLDYCPGDWPLKGLITVRPS